ncbi:transporter substrate-binding domain-containing protein [Actinomadura sp. LD22]|uniref:Transporter substrate-binding domain-containing protein n=1 Tax=Actinomadura physcomitrii TaxID=2650748 RepID=A0A6I4M287_9ACTN|nr:glutamate ABC transporter substrate-binding protein [Actinomadura physcomitrii]MVZ99471.1 transporter substrate-binding domain-containing protein [Actinomadura physcomitrii]
MGIRRNGHVLRAAAALLAAGTAALSAAACGIADAGESSIVHKSELTIGVNTDQPGLGASSGGTYSGFDIDVAREVARRLGVGGSHVRFEPVTSKSRESVIEKGKVDLVVASYSITPERKLKVAFAGPYYVAHQDVLVRASDASSVKNVHDLAGKRLCRVTGSVSYTRVHDELGVAALPADAGGYTACLDGLTSGRLDAISTDDLILAGLAAKAVREGHKVQVVNAPFSDEPYGIGLRKDDVDGCEKVNKVLTKMYQDGTLPKLLHKWFDPANLKVTTTVPQFEGCDEA